MGRVTNRPPVTTPSTLNVASNPSTATLIAQIENVVPVNGEARLHDVSWLIGVSTRTIVGLEHCASTSFDPSQIRTRVLVIVPSNDSKQYVTSHLIQPGDCLRMRVRSSFSGNAAGYISAEPAQ